MTLNMTGIGLELIGKRALAQIAGGLDAALSSQEDSWAPLDEALGYSLVYLERVRPENFYHGHRPSLVEAPSSGYPNVSVMAWQAQAAPEGLDEYMRFNVSLFVELMCKSTKDEGEVNSRTQRTSEAVHECMMLDPTLGGIVPGMRDTPNILLTDVFVRPELSGHGEMFYWQGARLEYTIEKFAAL